MIKVILPRKHGRNFIGLTEDVLSDVTNRLFKSTDYSVEYEDRSAGQYFKVIDSESGRVHYVIFNNSNDSRNTRLIQPFPVGYIDFIKSQEQNKSLDIYFINPETSDRTKYAKLFYRCFMTLGVNFLNFEILGLNGIEPYVSYSDLKQERNTNRDRNSHNESTYFEENDDDVTIFGKTDGVNEKESFILALTIAKIADQVRPVVFYPVKSDMSPKYRAVLEDTGISFEPFIETLHSGKALAVSSSDVDSIRNTKIYHLNLHQKFGNKQCYICDCDIEHLVIGAHIERVSDIKRNIRYTQNEKLERAVDGDNGLWLCANHDKMFEYGIIYFSGRELKIRSFLTDMHKRQYIEMSIFVMKKAYLSNFDQSIFYIRNEHYTSRMREYLVKHNERHSIAAV